MLRVAPGFYRPAPNPVSTSTLQPVITRHFPSAPRRGCRKLSGVAAPRSPSTVAASDNKKTLNQSLTQHGSASLRTRPARQVGITRKHHRQRS